MKLDLLVTGQPARGIAEIAPAAEAAGFDGLGITDTGRSAYLGCMAAGLSSGLHVCSAVAVAFPVSPMMSAQLAWELADVTGGKFRLGLGAQVKAHVERRFGAAYDPPGPRLRDYIRAVRAALRAFEGAELDYHGDFYELTLLPPDWAPGPTGQPSPPIDVAAVNPWMLRMAARYADGIHVHPLNTAGYLDQVVAPNVAVGASRAGKRPADVELIVPFFGAGGETAAERRPAREFARDRIALYGTTPNYSFIFDQLGFPHVPGRLRSCYRAGDRDGMRAAITDDLLGHFIVEGPWLALAGLLLERYGGKAGRLMLYTAGPDLEHDRAALEAWGSVARDLRAQVSGGAPG